MANKHRKRCSTSLIIRETQIETTMSSHLTPVRMAIIKKSTNNKYLRRCWEEGTLTLLMGIQTDNNHYREQYGDSLKTTNKANIQPSNTHKETRIERHIYTNVHCPALSTIVRTWKQLTYQLADEWIRKLWHIYTMEYYLAIKKNIFQSVLMRWMKLEPIIQSEVKKIKLFLLFRNSVVWLLAIPWTSAH